MAGSAAHGYSGKPLIDKLGLKAGARAIVVAPPNDYIKLVDGAPIRPSSAPPRSGAFDFIHMFVRTRADLAKMLPRIEKRLATGGMIWVSWPKKSSPEFIDLTEDGIRAVCMPMGLVDVKVCAVDGTWSGLKLMRRKS